MLVKMIQDKEIATHSLKKGKIYNLQSIQGSKLISLKVAKKPSKKEIEVYRNGN